MALHVFVNASHICMVSHETGRQTLSTLQVTATHPERHLQCAKMNGILQVKHCFCRDVSNTAA